MLRKAYIAFPSACVRSIGVSAPVASTSPFQHPERQSDRRRRIAIQTGGSLEYRQYSIEAAGSARDAEHENLPWPEVTSANAIPTPYQIFNQTKGAPYSKQRFYELVKIYHPDRHGQCDHVHNNIPAATKLERYRLVIAANNILSDPIKRGAYDAYGAGWHGAPGVAQGDRSQHGSWHTPHRQHAWDTRHGPSNNATWEDWEQWYQKGEKQEPIYLSNGAFFTIVLIVIGGGYLIQNSRYDNFRLSFTHQIDQLHNEMSRDLVRRRKQAMMAGDKDERIQEFLKARDPHGYGVTDIEGEKVRKLLPEPEICQSGDSARRAEEVDYSVRKATDDDW